MSIVEFFLGVLGVLSTTLLAAIAKIAWDTQQIVVLLVEKTQNHNEAIDDHESRLRVLEHPRAHKP
jgi:hypothetical protein